MTAWQTLTANSTLLSGTAWQHLNNQTAGSGGVVVSDGINVEVNTMTVEIELDVSTLEITMADVPVVIEFSNESIVLEVPEW